MAIEIYSAEARALIDRAVRQFLGETELPGSRNSAPQGGALYIGKTGGSGITARSSNTPGTGTVTLYTLNSIGDLTAQQDESPADVTVTAKNLSASAVGNDGWVMLQQDIISGTYWCVWEDCPNA